MQNKAVFLDRDGIINQEMGSYVYDKTTFHWVPGIFQLCKELHNHGYLLIVITNQGGISKGLYSYAQTEELHTWMSAEFSAHGCPLTDIYYSPFHKDISRNIMSKPSSFMLEKACAHYSILPEISWMIGDRTRDIICGKKKGCKTIGIGNDCREANPDFWYADIIQALEVFPF